MELETHWTQDAVAQRATSIENQSFVLTDDKGYGKTRTIGKIMESKEDLRQQRKAQNCMLQIFVTPSRHALKQQFADLKLDRSSVVPLSVVDKPAFHNKLMNKRVMRIVMTTQMVRQIFFGTTNTEAKFDRFVRALPQKTVVVFYIDELHSFAKRASSRLIDNMHAAIKRCNTRFKTKLFLHGMSATLPTELDDHVTHFFHRSFVRVQMTPQEKSEFHADVIGQPPAPDGYHKIELGSPIGSQTMAGLVTKLRAAVLWYAVAIRATDAEHNAFRATGAEPPGKLRRSRFIMARMQMQKHLSTIVCDLAFERHALLGQQVRHRVATRRYADGAFEAEPVPRWPGVLLSCSSPFLTSMVKEQMESRAQDAYNQNAQPFTFFDVCASDKRTDPQQTDEVVEQNFNAAVEAVRTQHTNGPTFAMITQTQRVGVNDFAKNFHVVVALDRARGDEESLSQYRGRVGRAATFQDGDLVPAAFEAFLIYSSWVQRMRDILATAKTSHDRVLEFLEAVDAHVGYGNLVAEYRDIVQRGDLVSYLNEEHDNVLEDAVQHQATAQEEDTDHDDEDEYY